jgi:hypothetical protein
MILCLSPRINTIGVKKENKFYIRLTQQFPTHFFDIDIAGQGGRAFVYNINANPTG